MVSTNYKMWYSIEDEKRCNPCGQMHGKIYGIKEFVRRPRPPVHFGCRCRIKPMQAINSISTELNGIQGAAWWLKHYGRLPEQYITRSQAKRLGWKRNQGNLHIILPGKMIGGDIYRNDDGHLPIAINRIWYEADLTYFQGFRTPERILYSSDGLVFITYDHYQTFIEVV